MEKIEQILKFENKDFEEIDFAAYFRDLDAGRILDTNSATSQTSSLHLAQSDKSIPKYLTLDQLIHLLRSKYPTLFYASKRLEKVLMDHFSQPLPISTKTASLAIPATWKEDVDCKVIDTTNAVTAPKSAQTDVSTISPGDDPAQNNTIIIECTPSTNIFTLASLTRTPLLDHLSPFLLSQGTFTLRKGFRGKHFQPEPFTLSPKDLSVLLVELEARGTRLRLTPSVSNLVTTASNQNTPLKFCLGHDYDDLVDSILAAATYTPYRARIDYFSEILTTAAEDGDIRMVRRLLQLGAEINSREVEWSALFAAASTNNIEICKLLVQYGANVNHAEEKSALYAAAYRGFMEICELLLEAGADVNVKNSLDGDTPIMAAVLKRHSDVVVFLTKSGADLSVKTSNGYSLLHLAIVQARMDIITFFLESCRLGVNERHATSGRTALHDAADKGRLESCKLLLDHGAIVDAVDLLGNTPLFYAAEFGHVEVCEFLIEKCRASISVKNGLGRSCVWKAVEKGNLEIVKILVDKTGPWILEEPDNVGETPGELAKRMGHYSNQGSFSAKRSLLTLFVTDQVAKSQSNLHVYLDAQSNGNSQEEFKDHQ